MPDSREAAALFYYLNRTGFNGLCRFNRRGLFNVPFGRYGRISYVRDFSEYREAFAAWTFVSRDVESVPIEPADFVYADPPYDVEFRSYAKDGFDWEHQERTAEWLARHRGPCVLMNQATRRILDSLPPAGLRGPLSRRAAAHQLQRRSHAGTRGSGVQERLISGCAA